MIRKLLLGVVLTCVATTSAVAANIVETAKASGGFTKLLAANAAAGTASILQGPGPFTIFAPNDDAFAKAPSDKLAMLMKPENKTMLKVALANHVVTGLLTKAQIDQGLDKSDAVFVMAANNMPLIIKRQGGVLTVNGAKVIKGPMKVDNGIIYVVDMVLIPAMPLQPTY